MDRASLPFPYHINQGLNSWCWNWPKILIVSDSALSGVYSVFLLDVLVIDYFFFQNVIDHIKFAQDNLQFLDMFFGIID